MGGINLALVHIPHAEIYFTRGINLTQVIHMCGALCQLWNNLVHGIQVEWNYINLLLFFCKFAKNMEIFNSGIMVLV